MAYSIQREVSDGTLVLLDISISYIERSEISVYFDDVLQTEGATWDWVGTTDAKISFSPAVPNLVEVTVKRVTDLSDLRHRYSEGAAFTAGSMDESFEQVLHIAQEATEGSLGGGFFTDINMHTYKIKNLGAAVDPMDAVPLAQYQADSLGAGVARDEAEAARDVAVAAKDTAVAAKDTAVASASTATTQAGIATTKAGEAAGSAAAALASQNAAAASYDSFDDRYLGAKASEPTLDNDGNALLTGALFFHIGVGMKAWNGAAWELAYYNTNDVVFKSGPTGAAHIPAGTTGERPGSPIYGDQRANSTLNQQEWWNGSAWVPMGGGATGAPGNNVFVENDQHVTGNYTITPGKNAMSAGPITIDDSVTVTIPDGSVWSIV